jgi:hypothetical protein
VAAFGAPTSGVGSDLVYILALRQADQDWIVKRFGLEARPEACTLHLRVDYFDDPQTGPEGLVVAIEGAVFDPGTGRARAFYFRAVQGYEPAAPQ